MIRIEKAEVIAKNDTDLFHQKQDLGEFTDFSIVIGEMPNVKTARAMLEYRKLINDKSRKDELPTFDKFLKGLLSVPSPKKDK
jgi:hypothetical protein